MTRLIIIINTALLLIAGVFIQPALSQDLDLSMVKVKISPKKNTILGIGTGIAPDYEGSEEFIVLPLMQARYNWSNGCYVNFLGTGIRANLIPSSEFEFGPLVVYRPARNSVKEEQVDNLKTVDAAAEAGAFASWSFDKFMLLLQAHADVTGAHNGYLIATGASYRIPLALDRKMQLILMAMTTYASENYMETYFGIDEENAKRSLLPVHKADAGIRDASLIAVLQYKLDKDWGILGLLKYARLLGDAADSPIVEGIGGGDELGDANQLMTGLLFNYSF